MLSLNYYFTPMRLAISKREPVRLTVELKNTGQKAEMVSLEVALPKELSFGKGSLKKSIVERIDSLSPKEEKIFHYDINAHPMYVAPGEVAIDMRAIEHYKNYSYNDKTYEKDSSLIVIE